MLFGITMSVLTVMATRTVCAETRFPLLARIIAVADAYNAMTSDRPYRDALPSRVARLRLAQAVESQFDTSVVAAFEAILAAAGEDYRMGVHEEFVLHGFSARTLTRRSRGGACGGSVARSRAFWVLPDPGRLDARANAELLEDVADVNLRR